jgi:septum site-determining protein MinD
MTSPHSGQLAGRALAVVSGKGGSGKTMIAAAIAVIATAPAAWSEIDEVVLVDADFGTAGLSYYLGQRYVRNIRSGMTDLVFNDKRKKQLDLEQMLQKVAELSPARPCLFLPIGDFRRLLSPRESDYIKEIVSADIVSTLNRVIKELRKPNRLVIVDCRGGVDDELIAVCQAVDEIVLVAEADTTSFQATRHVSDALVDRHLSHKITGFVLNKVLEDPSVLQRTISSTFGTRYLAAVPFDLEASRAFLVGRLPTPQSVFLTHVQEALSKAYPADVDPPMGRVWQPADYANLSLRSPGESQAGLFLGLVIGVTGLLTAIETAVGTPSPLLVTEMVGVLTMIGLLASIEATRRLIAALFERWTRPVRRRDSRT